MSKTVEVICRPEVAAGFGLAGLHTTEVEDPGQTGGRLRELREKPETGVVLVEQALYDQVPEEMLREWGRRALPMLVPFPGPVWETQLESAEAYIVELLRQVIGYRVRLR
jgi:vacuolar-type H+-ATPase subunit F/Vma7